ncbi:SusC/RagA family TonB-linked outer membrane protein [Daejeonella sp. H1SJ63]|uniref:SusC/RagA family TonB-linked outer membrane protein n=1 Tax=Daejeonella sp. H1SJ63 TaxID=3034145 RepID=UPI0023EB282F|nr:SusC/RagA family TonB-linked outer membrane protein [Daejeonella sp. H1SJ63]
MSQSNAPLKTVLKVLKSQSGYNFVYTDDLLKMAKPININVDRAELGDVLTQIFREQPLTYSVNKNTITLKEKLFLSLNDKLENELKDIVVRGKITDSKGETLPGVSVRVKGTTIGTSTDIDGRYSLNVSDNAILVISYIGYLSKEVAVSGRNSIDIVLEVSTASLNEVVVTALGIEREKRSLTYSTQAISTEELSEARELNVTTSLQGKVPGISISSAGTGVGASNRIVLRGNRSISGDSQPLYVIDGVPIIGDPSDISPDNIASLNVLKGPNAAALYGSAAQNGVIIIETKKGKTGAVNLSLNQTTQIMSPIHTIPFQNEYGQGIGGVYQKNTESSWGPKMTGQAVDTWSIRPEDAGKQYSFSPQPNNVKDAFQMGYNTATNIIASVGSENIQGMFTYTRTDAAGIVDGNKLGRNNMAVRLTAQLTKRLKLDTKVDYMQQVINDNLVEDINNFNPAKQIYMLPRNIRTEDAKNYTYTNSAGIVLQNFWTPGSTLGLNPYFLINRASNISPRERTIGMASLTYDIAKDLKFMARVSFDKVMNSNEEKLSRDFYARALNGRYTVSSGKSSLFNSDALLSYNKKVNEDWNFNINLGGNIRNDRNSSLSSNTGVGMIVPDFWTLSNTLDGITSNNPGPNIDVHSAYAFANIGWRNAIFLDITGRNDWSSTLPKANRSYFYPSVGLSVILSDLIEMPEFLSFAKLRGSWAKVGSGGPAYMLNRTATFSPGGNNGYLQLSSTLPNTDLRPEETKSLEYGIDLSFFNDRIGFNVTGYKTNTVNQLFTVALPPGSGASQFFTNGGDVENKGVELGLTGIPLKTANFKWENSLTFSRNQNLVNKLNDERPKLIVGSDQSFRDFVVVQGQPFGQIFSIGWRRDANGNVIVGSNGVPLNSGTRSLSVANAIPDWMGGFSNTFSFKNLNLSFLIDHRQGGTALSVTDAMLNFEGLTEKTLTGREGGLIFGQNLFPGQRAVKQDGTPNDIPVNAQTFWRTTGGVVNPVGEAFVESMTNTRLRELMLGYTFPKSLLRNLPVKSVKLSVVGRNLWFIYRASKTIDPDITAGTGVISEGQSAFAPPTVRSYGLNLKVDL